MNRGNARTSKFKGYNFNRHTKNLTMIQVIKAQDLNIIDLKEKFGIKLVKDDQFFTECLDNLPQITGRSGVIEELMKVLHSQVRSSGKKKPSERRCKSSTSLAVKHTCSTSIRSLGYC